MRTLRIAGRRLQPVCSPPLEHEQLRRRIRDKVIAGALPGGPAESVWAGIGSGRPCSACDEPIVAADTEIELETPAGLASVRFHRQCFALWRETCGH